MTGDSDPRREAIHTALQAQPPQGQEGAILTGWALVTQWMDPAGEQWLARAFSASTPHWSAKGMWHEALHGDWPEDDE